MANAPGTAPIDPAILDRVGQCARESVLGTLSSFCGELNVISGQSVEGGTTDGLIGVISMTGKQAVSMMMGFPRPTAEKLSKSFAGFAIDYDSPDMGDVVGELANVVGGDLVARLDKAGLKSALGLPTVVRGIDVELLNQDGVSSRLLGFDAPLGSFWVKLAVSSVR